jgi:hypothetical protein
MTGYRLYYMDRFSGHIDHRRDFVAAGDSAAVKVATGWKNGQPMELWQAGRKVKRWEAAPLMPLGADGGSSISPGA